MVVDQTRVSTMNVKEIVKAGFKSSIEFVLRYTRCTWFNYIVLKYSFFCNKIDKSSKRFNSIQFCINVCMNWRLTPQYPSTCINE